MRCCSCTCSTGNPRAGRAQSGPRHPRPHGSDNDYRFGYCPADQRQTRNASTLHRARSAIRLLPGYKNRIGAICWRDGELGLPTGQPRGPMSCSIRVDPPAGAALQILVQQLQRAALQLLHLQALCQRATLTGFNKQELKRHAAEQASQAGLPASAPPR